MRAPLVCSLGVLVACGGADPAPHTHPFWSDGEHLRDDAGRIAILRGVNARVQGVFDVTFADGRVALEPIPALTTADCARMRAMGLDLLRLPINWSGVEPTEGSYDQAYLDRVDAAIQCAGSAGIGVVVDLHQDAYSKEIGEDGAPLWAIKPAPTMLLQGPLTDLGDRRLSAQVQSAFETFFADGDPGGLRMRFNAMLTAVATRWADDPAVIGFELFNEPDTSGVKLTAFHVEAAATVRAAAPDKLVFFESPSVRNIADFVPESKEPFPVDGAVYSPHVYTYVFQSNPDLINNLVAEQLEPSVMGTRSEATAWRTPLFIGEFGIGPGDAKHDLWMQTEQQLHDRYLASNAFWVWKEQSQGSWGVYDYDATGDTWTERPQVVAWISRVHAARIAGTPIANESSPAGDSLRLEVKGASAPHSIYIPERFAATTTARCDGAALPITRDAATGLAELTCSGVLEVGP
ncbi:MAG: glycoside hydrolase family 5 protein [Deltaproteobacteria bacterium]|nr:glycoside hydrolase family 5 protein [Deltaproteobacteria bacterium]